MNSLGNGAGLGHINVRQHTFTCMNIPKTLHKVSYPLERLVTKREGKFPAAMQRLDFILT